jgi:cellulose synthase/poly-beta-1,6-N-acetylglucosamine synthase-like glycosyltransferase
MPLRATLLFALLMVFTYAGYPLVAFLLARIAGRGVKRATYRPTVSVILPVHNEGDRLVRKVRNLREQTYAGDRVEIIVVDDGSTDGSAERLSLRAPAGVGVVMLPQRYGKATAINAGLEAATGQVIVFTDARQTLEPKAIEMLLENLADPSVAAVTGRLATVDRTADGFFRRYVERLRSWEALWGSCAGVTGALYAVRRKYAAALPADTILDDLVMSLGAASRGRLVYDTRAVAIEEPQDYGRVWRRRLRTLAGNWQILLHPLRYRRILSARALVPLVCQKALRLFFPFFAAGFAISAAYLLPLAAILATVAVAVLGASMVAAFKRGAVGHAGQALASVFLAPVEALLLYLVGRETVLWAKAEGR